MATDFVVDVEAANERLAKMGINEMTHGGPPMTLREVIEAEDPEPRSPTGKRIRKDAGRARPKPAAPAPAPAGGLTDEQWSKVCWHIRDVEASAKRLSREIEELEASHRRVVDQAHAYLDSLKGGA